MKKCCVSCRLMCNSMKKNCKCCKPCSVVACTFNKDGRCTEPNGYKLFDDKCPEYNKRYSSGNLSKEDMEQA